MEKVTQRRDQMLELESCFICNQNYGAGKTYSGFQCTDKLTSAMSKLFHMDHDQEFHGSFIQESNCARCTEILESVLDIYGEMERLEKQIGTFRKTVKEMLEASHSHYVKENQRKLGGAHVKRRSSLQKKILDSSAEAPSFNAKERTTEIIQIKMDPAVASRYMEECVSDETFCDPYYEYINEMDNDYQEDQDQFDAPSYSNNQPVVMLSRIGEPGTSRRKQMEATPSPRKSARSAAKKIKFDIDISEEELDEGDKFQTNLGSESEVGGEDDDSADSDYEAPATKKRKAGKSVNNISVANSRSLEPVPEPTIIEDVNGSRLYCCGICGKPFKCREYANFHVHTHNSTRPFQCEVCGSGFTNVRQLRKHKFRHPCTTPTPTVESNDQVRILLKEYLTAEEISMKPTVIQTGSDRFYGCPICSRPFKKSENAKEHVVTHRPQTETTPEKPFNCNDCTAGFLTTSSLRKHIRSAHLGLTPAFKHNQVEKKIIKTESPDKPIKCSHCGIGMTRRSLKRHIRRFHLDLTADEPDKPKPLPKLIPEIDESGERVFKCKECPRTFKKAYELRNHIEMHKPSEERKYRCHVCPLGFAAREHLNRHIKRHDPNYRRPPDTKKICPICGVLCVQLKCHMKVHSEVKSFQCPTCGKDFRRKNTLITHIRTHTNERPYPCDKCSMSFKTSHCLGRHKLVHSEVKGFTCEYCSRAFRFKANLLEHLHIHTKEKPFKCNTCGKRFKEQCDFLQHVNVEHGPNAPKRSRDNSWRLMKGQNIPAAKAQAHGSQAYNQVPPDLPKHFVSRSQQEILPNLYKAEEMEFHH